MAGPGDVQAEAARADAARPDAARPVLFVLAGVNGAGKSSIGGHLLTQAGLAWFNPDTCARELVREHGYGQEDANIAAWNEGVRRLTWPCGRARPTPSKPRWAATPSRRS